MSDEEPVVSLYLVGVGGEGGLQVSHGLSVAVHAGAAAGLYMLPGGPEGIGSAARGTAGGQSDHQQDQ